MRLYLIIFGWPFSPGKKLKCCKVGELAFFFVTKSCLSLSVCLNLHAYQNLQRAFSFQKKQSEDVAVTVCWSSISKMIAYDSKYCYVGLYWISAQAYCVVTRWCFPTLWLFLSLSALVFAPKTMSCLCYFRGTSDWGFCKVFSVFNSGMSPKNPDCSRSAIDVMAVYSCDLNTQRYRLCKLLLHILWTSWVKCIPSRQLTTVWWSLTRWEKVV